MAPHDEEEKEIRRRINESVVKNILSQSGVNANNLWMFGIAMASVGKTWSHC